MTQTCELAGSAVVPLDLAREDDLQFAVGILDRLGALDTDIERTEAKINKLEVDLKGERKRREELVTALRKETRTLREPLPPLYAAALDGERKGSPVDEQPSVDVSNSPLLSEVFAGLHKAISGCYAGELQTLAQLQAFLDTGKTLRDIEGVGARTAKEMEERLTEYAKRVANA